MAGSASFKSAEWQYRPNYFAVWSGLPGCEWEYYRLNRPGGKPGLQYRGIPIRNSYLGPRKYLLGIWMHGNNRCYLLTPKQLVRGQCVSSPITCEEMMDIVSSTLENAGTTQPTHSIFDLGSTALATQSLHTAIERLKATYPELSV